MSKWMTKKRITMLATLPLAGLCFTILLNFFTVLGYSTSMDQEVVNWYATVIAKHHHRYQKRALWSLDSQQVARVCGWR